MPIQVQCCGLFLMLILMYFYKSQKIIKLNTERAFWRSFVMTFVCIGFDILSCVAISCRDALPDLLVKFVSKTYLATLVGVSFFALLYICTDIYTKKTAYKKIMIQYGIFVAAAVILIYALPIYFYENKSEGVLYSYGPSDYATYIFALATLIIVAVRLFREKSKISSSRQVAVKIWLGVWVAAAIVQFIFPKLLLVGFASAVGMLVLYLVLENPGNNIDRQTGLFNHGAFLQYTKQLYDTGTPFAALAIVLEHNSFKTMRTDVERDVIAEASSYLSGLPDVLVFKNTGTEILLIFPETEISESAVRAIRERFDLGWGKSGGVMVEPYWIYVPDSGLADNSEDLLYLIRYVKQNSKEFSEDQFIEVSDELAARLRKEKEVEQLIVDALKNDWLEVWYQPIYSTKKCRFTSAEALVRIRNRDGALVPPGIFIETAERNGMILQIGEAVFRKVCCFLSQNDVKQYGIKYIEVNLSVVQCAYGKLADDYISIIEEYGISPDLINLEITESASMNAKKTLLENMKQLMDYGVKFSLDDFGTGQSNLDYIADMPVNIVKFDKGMTNAYFENGKTKYIMNAATNMIQGMNLKIVSEGIETEEQFKTMHELGINYIQGYYFSKPLPEKEFLEFLLRAKEETEKV
ncbi:MAG: EAL domain-containing protein [Ruminococcaceae bacterium]|nr:EAL domain-containing protein [Oscillospiraceae bacterium]